MTASTTAPSLVLRRRIDATPETLFAAWTSAESLRVWMCPGDAKSTTATLDVRVGGSFEIIMHGASADYHHRGVYRVVDRPKKLVFTWISKGTAERESVVRVELKGVEGGTELTLTHEGLPTDEAARQHSQGWGEILDQLARTPGLTAR